MKIITGHKDKRAIARISYKPSQYLLEFAKEDEFGEQGENGTSEYEYMSEIMAIFTDMLEVISMDYGFSSVSFGNALEGLITGVARQLALNYGVDYDNETTIQELLEILKQKISFEKEAAGKAKKRDPDKETSGIKNKKNNVIFLKKPFK